MINFKERSGEKELLDMEDIPFADIQRNMQELNFINKYLGGHSITLEGFKKLAEDKQTVSVCEIGCGGGDNLNAIYKWIYKKNRHAKLTGIDINANCIAYAQRKSNIRRITFISSDYRLVNFGKEKPDIIFASLFCHHFTRDELIKMMAWMNTNSAIGFFINDLHRHPVAYYLIKMLTSAFSSSYLVKNDAPLSVLRGFEKREWIDILKQAGIKHYSIKWKWAFRYLLTIPTCQE